MARIIRPPAPLRPGAGRKTPAQQQAESDIYRRLNTLSGAAGTVIVSPGTSSTGVTRKPNAVPDVDLTPLLARLHALDTLTDAEQRQIADLADQIAALGALADTTPRLLTGGEITPLSGTLGLHLAAGTLFNGTTTVSFDAQDILLTAADATNARFDELAQDLATGALSAVPGIASATPFPPDYDPDTDFDRGPVLVAAGATTVGSPDIDVFHEGVEWTGTASNGTWSLSTGTPRTGTHSLSVSGNAGAYTLTAPSAVPASAVSTLTLWVSISSWPATRAISVWFQQPGSLRRAGSTVALRPGTYGLTGVTGVYQQATIPLSAFGAAGASFGGLKLSLAGSGGAVAAAFDDIVLTGSVGMPAAPPVPTASSLVTGTVKTTVDHADPVVYEKTEMDTLLGGKTDGPPLHYVGLWDNYVGYTKNNIVKFGVSVGGDNAFYKSLTTRPDNEDIAPNENPDTDTTNWELFQPPASIFIYPDDNNGLNSPGVEILEAGGFYFEPPLFGIDNGNNETLVGLDSTAIPISLPPNGAAGGDLSGSYPNPILKTLLTAGSAGDGTHSLALTWDAKGRITSAAAVAIAFPTSLPPSGAAGGDLTGTFPNPTLAAAGTAGTYGDATHYPIVTVDSKGRVTGITLQNAASIYILPTASTTVLGGVKVGSGLSVDGSGALSATSTPRAPLLVLPGAVTVGANAIPPLRVPAFMNGLSLTRLQARVETPGTTDTTLTLLLSTSTGAFVAAVTSQTVTITAGTYEVDIPDITTTMTLATGNKLGINITAAGTGATDLSLTATFG